MKLVPLFVTLLGAAAVASTQTQQSAQVIPIEVRAQALNNIFANRRVSLGENPAIDGCTIFRFFDGRADYLTLIDSVNLRRVRVHTPQPCSPEVWDRDTSLHGDQRVAMYLDSLPVYLSVWDARREQDKLILRLQVTRDRHYIEETHILYQSTMSSIPAVASTPWYCKEINVHIIH